MSKELDSDTTSNLKSPHKLSLSLDYRVLCGVLLLIIAAMLAVWHPWASKQSNAARTITVTGSATIQSAPDVFVFSPLYEVRNADKTVASDELIAKQAEVVAGLKKLGVADNKIKTNTGGYSSSFIDDADVYQYTTNMEITIDTSDKALTQKVQDYLVTTIPTGSVSPYGSFSEPLRKKLESRGRDAATKDARSKAEQSAKNLGFKIGSVKSVSDGVDTAGDCLDFCTYEKGTPMSIASDAAASLPVQAGENDLYYSVTVTYYVK